MKLDKATRDRLKMYRKGKRAQRKLKQRKGAEYKARHMWKCILANCMREFPTPSEAMIAPSMKRLGFLSQVVLFGYIADFAHESKRVIVEIDGSVHDSQKEYDHHRDEVFRSHGWKVCRITNQQVRSKPLEVYEFIKSLIA